MEKLEFLQDQVADIKSDVKEIKSDVYEIKTTMAVNTSSLEHHIARTNTLQDLVTEFKTELVEIKDKVAEVDIRNKNQAAWINGVFKSIIAIAAIVEFLRQTGLLSRIINLF